MTPLSLRAAPLVLLSFLLLTFTVGCSDAATSCVGIVRFSDGQRVRSGSVEFRSLATGDRYAARIDDAGHFNLVDNDGRTRVPAGEYEVVVVQIVLTEDLALEAHSHGQTVPRRYADYFTSDLRVSVPAPADRPAAGPVDVICETSPAD